MSPQVIVGLIVGASIAAWLAFLGYLAIGGKRPHAEDEVDETAAATPVEGAPAYLVELETPEPAARAPRVEEETRGISRRQFLNRAWMTGVLIGLAQFGAASLDFLWPRLRGGLGTKINAGRLEDIQAEIEQTRTPKFIPDGRFFITMYQGDPSEASEIPAYKAANTAEAGVVALFRKCVHLGCSVPWCITSQWFECPCHGSKYSVNGEYRDGPAPRGLDRFRVEVVNGEVIVDTSTIIQGPPRGVTTSQPQPEGSFCIVLAEE